MSSDGLSPLSRCWISETEAVAVDVRNDTGTLERVIENVPPAGTGASAEGGGGSRAGAPNIYQVGTLVQGGLSSSSWRVIQGTAVIKYLAFSTFHLDPVLGVVRGWSIVQSAVALNGRGHEHGEGTLKHSRRHLHSCSPPSRSCTRARVHSTSQRPAGPHRV